MSGSIDIYTKKRVLLIAANSDVSPTTGWPIGFWWAELTHPYWTFAEAGYDIDIASPKALLTGTKSIRDVDLAGYDAIFVAGGQSPMITMIDDTDLHAFVARAYEAGKIVAIVCHGTCVLLKTRLSNGDLLVKGKTWTGFANSEEAFADSFVGKRIQPFWIEEEARKLEGTNFIVNSMFKAFAVRDGNLITGQQQFSGAAAAELVVETLGR
jgi:putative intracellular protease/amidase